MHNIIFRESDCLREITAPWHHLKRETRRFLRREQSCRRSPSCVVNLLDALWWSIISQQSLIASLAATKINWRWWSQKVEIYGWWVENSYRRKEIGGREERCKTSINRTKGSRLPKGGQDDSLRTFTRIWDQLPGETWPFGDGVLWKQEKRYPVHPQAGFSLCHPPNITVSCSYSIDHEKRITTMLGRQQSCHDILSRGPCEARINSSFAVDGPSWMLACSQPAYPDGRPS